MRLTPASTASAADSGVTVRQVMMLRTVAASSPSSKPTLSQAAARERGAKRFKKSATCETSGMLLLLPTGNANDRQHQNGDEQCNGCLGHCVSRFFPLVFA